MDGVVTFESEGDAQRYRELLLADGMEEVRDTNNTHIASVIVGRTGGADGVRFAYALSHSGVGERGRGAAEGRHVGAFARNACHVPAWSAVAG